MLFLKLVLKGRFLEMQLQATSFRWMDSESCFVSGDFKVGHVVTFKLSINPWNEPSKSIL